jgi:hypothetical protein
MWSKKPGFSEKTWFLFLVPLLYSHQITKASQTGLAVYQICLNLTLYAASSVRFPMRCRVFVTQNKNPRGHIAVHSEQGRGSTFKVCLPALR